ncbi:NusG domain II-containing protein [Anaerotignum sp.]|uniref:NusG domain II-containing protein n=1 Tax=Anaerotignum sp. TaxID=2039241 RepID=UPI0028AB0858|nr:NusG domain II-containing protein [Anaerotignum sp.]
MKKADKILIIVLLVVAAGLALFFYSRAEEGGFARVLVDGEVKVELPLTEDTVFTVETQQGYNEIKVEGGYVSIQDADCRDQICVEHKKIHLTGETIVCLPHKLVVEIVGEKETEFDMVVG